MQSNNVVYKIVNITNNKEYVGSTTKGILERKRQHLRRLKKRTHHSRYLQNAYNIVGPDNFLFIILEELPTSENLIERETYWAKLLKPEYNVMKEIKSHIGVKRTAETCKRISVALTGKPLSKEHRESIRISSTGKKQSAETIQKRMEPSLKPILQFTKDGTFVKEWKSATDAEIQSNKEYTRKGIYRSIWGGYGRKSYKNYVWKYKNIHEND